MVSPNWEVGSDGSLEDVRAHAKRLIAIIDDFEQKHGEIVSKDIVAYANYGE